MFSSEWAKRIALQKKSTVVLWDVMCNRQFSRLLLSGSSNMLLVLHLHMVIVKGAAEGRSSVGKAFVFHIWGPDHENKETIPGFLQGIFLCNQLYHHYKQEQVVSFICVAIYLSLCKIN